MNLRNSGSSLATAWSHRLKVVGEDCGPGGGVGVCGVCGTVGEVLPLIEGLAWLWGKVWVEGNGLDAGTVAASLANGRSGAECNEETFFFNRVKHMFPLFYRGIGAWFTIGDYFGEKSRN